MHKGEFIINNSLWGVQFTIGILEYICGSPRCRTWLLEKLELGDSRAQDPPSQLYSSQLIYFILLFLNTSTSFVLMSDNMAANNSGVYCFKTKRDWAPFLSPVCKLDQKLTLGQMTLPFGLGYSALVKYLLLTSQWDKGWCYTGSAWWVLWSPCGQR